MIKYFKPINYYFKYKYIIKHIKFYYLSRTKVSSSPFKLIWIVKYNEANEIYKSDYYKKTYIFGNVVDLFRIDWFLDKESGFIFELEKCSHLNIESFYNKGIDVKYTWEISRFYFGISLAQHYLISGDNKYYDIFKFVTYSFIQNNPYLTSINWFSPMESSIRAVNWIISLNLFGKVFINDTTFHNDISRSLLLHAYFINEFPEVYSNGLTTNHTITNYASLFFLGLTFSNIEYSQIWINKSINGLEHCISEQVYNDGVDFEGSIAYHRLVLEVLAFTTIVARANDIYFSENFYLKLFKMFEFSAAYMDYNGNAPQVGDNDSGRFIIFSNALNNNHYLSELDHSYLLTLGEHIFDYNFKSQCYKRDKYITNFLPAIKKVPINNVIGRNTQNSIVFNHGGAYLLKNRNISLLVSCFPLGQKGKGGHNHLDTGSFTLSVMGRQIIVDPGTYTYTRDKRIRDKFRSYTYHNTLFNDLDLDNNFSANSYWELKEYYRSNLIDFSTNNIKIDIKYIHDLRVRHRHFYIMDDSCIIEDKYESDFYSRFNLHPDNIIISKSDDFIETNFFTMHLFNHISYNITDYDYSSYYNYKTPSKCIVVSAKSFLKIKVSVKSSSYQ